MNAGILQYCNTGHNPAIWREAATGSIRLLKSTAPAIGLTQNADFKSGKLKFNSGDLLLLYTDGLTEARNSEDEEFGEERLINYVNNHHNESADDFLKGIRENVVNFAESFHDDVTMLVIKFQ